MGTNELLDGIAEIYHDISQEVTAVATANKAKVFMSGRSQAVRIPMAFRFEADEVFIRRDAETGDVILSQVSPEKKMSLKEVFALLDSVGVPMDFMADRDQGRYSVREEL